MIKYIVLDQDVGKAELCYQVKEQEFDYVYVYDENENRRVRTVIPKVRLYDNFPKLEE